MLEWAIVPLLIGAAAMVPKSSNDKKKIQIIFENTCYGVRNKKGDPQFPKFKKKLAIIDGDEEIGIRYLFSIPLGLPATKASEMEKNVGFFSDGLNRPVITEYRRITDDEDDPQYDPKKYLIISVFNKDIPKLFPYKKVPSPTPIMDDEKVIKIPWIIPLGRSLETIEYHNFAHIPHLTVAGMTRFGKTVFLKVLSTYLIEHHPEEVRFVYLDLKGGLEFGRYENLKQVIRVAGDPFEALEVLSEIHEEMMNLFKLFRQNYWTNIEDTPLKKRTFVVVDEAAQLAPEKWMPPKMKQALEQCQWILGEITRMGGGLGYREIFCTQYPTADTLPRSVKQNADGKMAFRLPTGYASDVAIDERGAETLPSNIKGRALYKTHEIKELQVPFISDKEMWYRLSKYVKGESSNEIPNTSGEEKASPGTDFVKFGGNAVRNQGTNSKKTQSRKGPKHTPDSKRNEGIPSNQNTRGEEHLLPKRKRKGISRKRTGGEMEPTDRSSFDEE